MGVDVMPVPYIFSNVPGGTSIPLSELDACFAYCTTAPTLTNLTLTGNLTVGGTSTFNGPAVFNNTLTIDGVTINPTGITGTGELVFNNTPTLISPILGTPTSGNLSNCTNLPISTGVSGMGAGVAAALAVPPDTAGGFVTYSSNTTVPTGAVFHFAAGAVPAGYLICNGASYPTATYPDLFAVVGYTFGGSGANFNVPDLTGLFIRGVGGNSASLGVAQIDSIISHNHNINDPGHTHSINDPGHTHNINDPGHTHTVNDPGHSHSINDPGHNHSINDPGHNHSVSDPGHTHPLNPPPISQNAAALPGFNAGPVYSPTGYLNNTSAASTGISVQGNTTGVSNVANTTSITNNSNTTSVSNQNAITGISNNSNTTGATNASSSTGVTTQNFGGSETRPVNMALLPCIKY